jgi:acetylglutamate kinase
METLRTEGYVAVIADKETYKRMKTFITAAHDAIRATTRQLKTHGRIDGGVSQKLNLRTEAQQFHQKF